MTRAKLLKLAKELYPEMSIGTEEHGCAHCGMRGSMYWNWIPFCRPECLVLWREKLTRIELEGQIKRAQEQLAEMETT